MTKQGAPEWVVKLMWFGRVTSKQAETLASLGFVIEEQDGWVEFTKLKVKADTANAALGRVFRWIWTVGIKSIRHEVSHVMIMSAEHWEYQDEREQEL